jgi:Putative adhesin
MSVRAADAPSAPAPWRLFMTAGASPRLLFLPVLFALAGCDMSLGNLTGRASDEWLRRYPLSPGGEIRVVNTNGKIEVEPSEGSEVEIRAERIARAATDAGARELLPRITIKEDISPDRVSVETERMSGIMIGARFEVRYHVRAPKNAFVNVANTNGQVALTGLAGRVTARTTNGAVTARGLTGGVEARTTNGAVNLDFASLGRAPISARTTNGAVVLAVPEDAKADVTASWTNGGINIAPDLKLEVTERSRRRFEGRMNGGGTPIELQTTNGGIRLRPRAAAEAEESKGEKGL